MDTQLKLNKEQLDAIKFGDGPLLIIAGAGTGKTTVVTERIKYLILSKKVKPDEVLALTFTEKAAREMEERVDLGLPYGYTQMWTMTFHSFCDRILRAEALNIGLDPKFRLMTVAESVQLVRSNLFNFDLDYFRPLGNPNKFISGMLTHFSRLQDEDVSPDDYIKWLKKSDPDFPKWSELANAYKKYDELKTIEGKMDFGDLITKTLKLFRERPNILKEYQKKFKYVLVDEFQDTNYSQNEIVKLLVGTNGNITVVGDDDQSVYKFRGAAVSNIIQFRKNFPKTKVVVLTKNYRSTQKILDRAYDLIQFNNPDRLEVVEKIDKRLKAVSGIAGENLEFIHADRVENEADMIAQKIKDLNAKDDYAWGDVAILVRANTHADTIVRALTRSGIPHQFLGPGKLFKQPEIIDLVSYLKVLNNYEDSVSFYRILSIDFFKIEGREIATLGAYARKNNISLFESAEKIGSENVKVIVELITKHLSMVPRESAGQLLYYFLTETKLLQKLLSPDTVEGERVAQNVSKFFDKIKTYEVDHEDAGVASTVAWLELAMELGESPLAANEDWTEVDAVNILTVHSAKGLEFPIVFLPNLVAQRFPTTERREQIPIPEGLIKEILPLGDYHQQEERRLFYVGMTRAKERLFLTAADYYGEGKREKKLSPFVYEAMGDGMPNNDTTTSVSEQLTFLTYEPVEIKAGGSGTIPLKIDYLSYSQIEAFNICPLHYKLRYIYKVPTPPSGSQSFGITMHATLKSFFDVVTKGNKPTEKLLYELLEKHWIKEGFSGKSHEEKFKQKGRLYLKGFLKEGFDPRTIPSVMEQPFAIPLVMGGRRIKIGGTMDRVDIHPDGTIEIIDYKTGATIPTQKEVDKNLQLSFYALAATKIPNKPFGVIPEKIKLSLYYLDTQEKLSTVRTQKQLEEAAREVFKVADSIEKSDFTCSDHIFCQGTCEYSIFCKSEAI